MSQPGTNTLKVAVVTGGHTFDVPGMYAFRRDLDGIDAYLQSLEDWSDDVADVRDRYDCVVFYNMHRFTPTGDEPWPMHKAKAALERLGETDQGIVIWHHALVAFPEWPRWREITGIADTSVEVAFDQPIPVTVEEPDHPIVADVRDFTVIDETYGMAEPVGDMAVLLRAHYPKQMSAVGWTRTFGKARVFCLQLGHDNQSWSNPSIRSIVGNGVRWASNRL